MKTVTGLFNGMTNLFSIPNSNFYSKKHGFLYPAKIKAIEKLSEKLNKTGSAEGQKN